MFESMPEMTTAVKALIFVLFLIVAVFGVFWALRRYAGAGANAGARGRQPRLGQVDYIDLPDGRRKLIIVRRDNVEHLVMIGGPNDVVVEQNIVRGGAGAQRGDKPDPALGRVLAAVETLPRPVPLGEPTAFPLQPQTENNGRAPRAADDQAQWPAPAEPERKARPEPRLETRPAPRANAVKKPPNEVSTRAAAPREPAVARPVAPPVSRPAPAPPAPVAAPAPAAPTPVIPPPVTPPSAPIVKVGIDEKIMANAGPDQNLTDMANMLEASLRRQSEPRFTEGPMAAKPAPMVPPPAPSPSAKVEAKPAAPKATYDSLEEEMASLLGRPPGKP